MYIKKLSLLCLSVLLTGSSFVNAYHRSFENKTPYPLIITIKRVAGGETTRTVNAGKKETIDHGIYAIKWVKIQADIPGKGYVDAVSEKKSIGAVSLDYLIFCEPKIKSKQVPTGVEFTTDKLKFYLFRYSTTARPGGIVSEGAWINLTTNAEA